jgi:hypothetical protein
MLRGDESGLYQTIYQAVEMNPCRIRTSCLMTTSPKAQGIVAASTASMQPSTTVWGRCDHHFKVVHSKAVSWIMIFCPASWRALALAMAQILSAYFHRDASRDALAQQ